ncbi:hypothetical protein [Ilumatobacter sp.]|uniref:hypothetical protein n=1 Tax=Ilumatobacter sp. TaxID=1967498 RepID=UPI003AF6F67A
MDTPTAPADPGGSSYAPDLRRRADELGELARSIERSLVMTLIGPAGASDGEPRDGPIPTDRDRLNAAMLERNLHQLHRAADDLRVTAMRFRQRADELDDAARAAA